MSLQQFLRYRTLVLGLVVLVLLVGTAVWSFGADGAQMLRFALACLLLLVAMIAAGAVGALLLVGLRRWRAGTRNPL